jgi:alcohol dehydrogenase class IV
MTAAAFEFATAGRIVAGAGRGAELPDIVAGLGSRVLVCTGADPARHGSLLADLGLPAAVFPVAGEPTAELARTAAAAAREHGADVIAAIGGGSVIDLGKAVAMLLANGGDPLDYLEVVGSGQKITQLAAPCVAVPTTAGTGAEVTANAVLAVPGHRLKASLRSPLMIPRVALVDPELTVSCPPPVTAASGLDALTQCLEPFVSVRATPLTDGLAREGLRRAATGLRAAHADGGDLAARTDMAMCALLGGMALANAKLGAVHGRALRSVAPGSSVLDRYAEAAQLLTGKPGATVEDGLAWIGETVSLLGVPGLAAFGLGPGEADGIAAKAATSSSMQGNPVPLSHDELKAVVLQATTGNGGS